MRTSKSAKAFRSMALITAAVAGVAGYQHRADGATLTWTGSIPDPNSALYTANTSTPFLENFTLGTDPVYVWNAAVQNWSTAGNPAAYTVGDSVVFTDNVAGGKFFIHLTSSGLNPTAITFADAGAGATNYTIMGADLAGSGFSSNSAWNPPYSSVLTLDTGFTGKVTIRTGGSSNGGGGTANNTIIRSGILEFTANNTLPANGNNSLSAVELAGGELRLSFSLVPSPGETASTQLGGTLTVSENSILTNNSNNAGNGRVWGGGPINIAAGKTLTIQSIFNSLARTAGNFNGSAGTVLLQDTTGIQTRFQIEGATAGANSMSWNVGTGTSQLQTNQAATTLAALYGGAGTTLRGSSATGVITIGTKNVDTTFDGIITNTGIAKAGTGTLTLTNAETYTGATNVSGGVLLFNGANGSANQAGSVNLSGGILRLDNTSANNNDRIGNTATVSLSGGALEFVANLAAPTAEVAGPLTVTASGNTVRTIAAGSGSPAAITFASLARTGGVVDFSLDPSVNVSFTAAPTLTNGIIGAYATVGTDQWATISGSNVAAYTHAAGETDTAPATWAATQNINLTAGGTSTVAAPTTINSLRLASNATVSISAGQALTIGTGGLMAAGTSGSAIAGTGSLTAGSGAAAAEVLVQVPNAANTLTISAPVADNGATGTVSLVKAGAGKLILSGTNTFTGGFSLIGGTLSVGSANALPNLGALTVDFGTTFDLGGFSQSVATVTLINGNIVNSGGPATLSGTSLNVRLGTVSAALGGSGSLSKTTGGAVTLTGANTYTGGTVVTGGTLTAGAANVLPAGGTVNVNSGAVVNVGAFNQSGLATVTLGNGNTTAGSILGTGVVSGSFYDIQNGTITAVLGPTGDLSKSTAGNATLTAANTYTGVTTISGGVLNVTTLGNGSVASGIGQSGSAASNLVLAGGTLSYIGTPNVSTDRQFQLNSDSGLFNNSATGTLTIASTAGIAGGGGKIVLGGSNTGTNVFNMSIGGTNSGNGLTKTGGGRWVLGQSNTYTGDTTIAQGTLEIGAFNQNVSKIHVTGGGVYGTGIITTNQDIDMQGGTLGAVIAQTGGNIAMIKGAGFGTSIMNHTFTGRTEIGGSGTLMINAIANGGVASPIGASTSDASNLVFGGVGTLLYIGAGASTDRLFTLNGNGAIASSGTGSLNFTNTGAMAGGGSTLTLGGTFTGANTLAASIGGSGGLTKADAGQWILSNTGSTYTDRTTVSGGVLSIASIADLASPSSIGAPTDTDPHRLIVGGGGTLKYIGAGSSSNRAYTIGLDTAAAAAGNATFDSSGTGALQLTNTGTVSRGGGTGNIVLGLAGTNVGNNTLAGVIGDASISVTKSGAGKWILSANNSYGGTTTVTGGTLVFSTKIPNTPVSVTGGVLQVAAKGTPNSAPGTSVIKSFASTGGTLDLTNNSMVIDYSGPVGTQVSDLRGHLKAGRLSTSSGTTTTRLGYADNATLGKSTFGGISVDSDSILVKYTYAGDSDLDGDADGVDIGTWATNFTGELGGAGSAVWTQGDWDYDGDVDGVDAGLWAQAFTGELGGGGLGDIVVNDPTIAPGAAAILRGMGITVVPEPASLGLVGLMAASSLWRPGSRKRRDA